MRVTKLKTQITDWLFLYNTIQQVIFNKLNVKLKIFYFSLEMSKEEKFLSVISNILYIKEGIRIAPKDLRSTKKDKVLPKEYLDIIAKYEYFFEKFEEIVEFIDDIRNPTGIYKVMRAYAFENGKIHTKRIVTEDGERDIFDYYEPNDPEEYVMCIVDHISLLSTERIDEKQLTLHETIGKLSYDYFVKLRNMFNYIPVVIQQQAASQESVENMKYNRLHPTMDGLAENKTTQRDANVILGLFDPFRHKIPEYLGYDIKVFKDNIRFLEILGGREGGGGTIVPLFFDGASNFFRELPNKENVEGMNKVYNLIKEIRR